MGSFSSRFRAWSIPDAECNGASKTYNSVGQCSWLKIQMPLNLQISLFTHWEICRTIYSFSRFLCIPHQSRHLVKYCPGVSRHQLISEPPCNPPLEEAGDKETSACAWGKKAKAGSGHTGRFHWPLPICDKLHYCQQGSRGNPTVEMWYYLLKKELERAMAPKQREET